MDKEIIDNCLEKYCNRFQGFWTKSIGEWIEENIEFKGRYSLSKLDLSLSPYLYQPFDDIKDPNIFIVILAGAPQTAKTMASEGCIFYWLCNDAGPVMRLHDNQQKAKDFAETRFLPTVRGNQKLLDLLDKNNRFAMSVDRILFPHMVVNFNGPGDDGSMLHGYPVKYMLCDEAHEYDAGILGKAETRTIGNAGRGRKMIITSQPNEAGSDYYNYYQRGQIFQWQWKCPKCGKFQPYQMVKERPDGTFAGFNCEKILAPNTEPQFETRDIQLSARTTWLECEFCCYHVEENAPNRRLLNDTAKFICIKSDGDPQIKAYTWPVFVNPNITYASCMVKYFEARRTYHNTGVKKDWVDFTNQIMGEFYKADKPLDISKIMISDYDPNATWPEERFRFMTVDNQKTNWLKYWIIRAWDGKGNSRLLDLGIARTWDEIATIQKKWNIKTPCVGVDCGFSNKQQDESVEVFAECIKHGEPKKDAAGHFKGWYTWTALRGAGEVSFKHEDGVKFYSILTKGNPNFPVDSKYKGLGGCNRYVWANWPVKNILMNLRDNKYSGITWTTNVKDSDYDAQLYSERVITYLDKKTNMPKERWEKVNTDNHYLDCECMNLVLSMMAGAFSVVGLTVDEILKDIDKIEKKDIKTTIKT